LPLTTVLVLTCSASHDQIRADSVVNARYNLYPAAEVHEQLLAQNLRLAVAAIARHKRAGRIEQRDGKLYATQSTETAQRAAV
jgi:hypothetical protein